MVGTAPGSSSPGAWTFGVGLDGANSTAPDVSLNNISLDLGDFLNKYLGTIINPLAEVLKPIQPILDFLATPIPIINEPLIQAVVELFGGEVDNFSQVVSFVDAVVNFVSDLSNGSSLIDSAGQFQPRPVRSAADARQRWERDSGLHHHLGFQPAHERPAKPVGFRGQSDGS